MDVDGIGVTLDKNSTAAESKFKISDRGQLLQYAGFLMKQGSGTNFVTVGDIRFQPVDGDSQRRVNAEGGDLLITTDCVHSLIAAEVAEYQKFLKHLQTVGVMRLENPLAEAKKKIPISLGVRKILSPIYSLILGDNCYDDLDKSLELHQAMTVAAGKCVEADIYSRIKMSESIEAFNAGTLTAQALEDAIYEARGEYAGRLSALGLARLQAIQVLNGMDPELAVAKLNMGAHYINRLFTSPLDRIEVKGGMRASTVLYSTIENLLGELRSEDGFFQQIRTCGWLSKAINKARLRYSELDAALPPSHEINSMLDSAPNSIEGMLRFSHSIAEMQKRAYENEDTAEKVDRLLGAAETLGYQITAKIKTLPQTCVDAFAGIDRRGQDQYGVTEHVVDDNDPLAAVLGCPEVARATYLKKTYADILGEKLGSLARMLFG